MRRLLSYTLLIFILSVLIAGLSHAQQRSINIVRIKDTDGKDIGLYKESHALLIGVSNYKAGWPKLPGVKRDIADVKEILQKQGFSVTVVSDPNHETLIKAFTDFINRYGLKPDNRLLFYFAGHGHTIKQAYGEEMGYIVPTDAPNPNKDKDGFLSKAMDMQQIEVYAKRIQSKHALFLFDSCFSGSIFALSRAVPESITYKTNRPVRQFITSGSAEETVPDKSIFRDQFISALKGEADLNKDGYVTGTELGEFLQDKVVNYSRAAQHPQYGKIRNPNLDKGDFVFQVAALPQTVQSDIDDTRREIAEERKKLEEEKARIASEKKRLEEQRLADEKAKIEAERKAIEEERVRLEQQRLAMATRPPEMTARPFTDPATGMEFVFVKGGCYDMGDTFGDGYSDEKPVHNVCVSDFYIGKYEVTQGHWKAIMGDNPSRFSSCGDNCPVEQVSWNDVQEFIRRLNSRTGKTFRLPTEAEWEYAARSGGKREKYAGTSSDSDLGDYAWYGSNSGNKTHPVGTKKPNSLGIYDMSGNVWEWCQDWYSSDYYRNSPRDNPQGPSSGSLKLLRGGSWSSGPLGVRAAVRVRVSPGDRFSLGGFRVVSIPR